MQDNPFKINDKVYTFNDPDPYFITYISKYGICTLSNESGGIKLRVYWEKLSFTPIIANHNRPESEDNRKYRNAKISMVYKMKYPDKRLFQTLDEMNKEDIDNKSNMVCMSYCLLSTKIVDDYSGTVTYGVPNSWAMDIQNGERKAILIMYDIKEFLKCKAAEIEKI